MPARLIPPSIRAPLAAGFVALCLGFADPVRAQADPQTVRAIEATAYDYVDGQLEGNAERVARALHPDLAKRRVKPAARDETLGLARMTSDELIGLTRQGALKTPKEQWRRTVEVLRVDRDIATVRVETPWFVDHLQIGRFGDRWVIVNALWHGKPQS